MISKKDLIARGKASNPNPYGLTQKQLDELEVTKVEVSNHLKTIDFSRHTQADNPEVQRQVETVYKFTHLINRRSKWDR